MFDCNVLFFSLQYLVAESWSCESESGGSKARSGKKHPIISFEYCVRKEGPVVPSFQARLEAELSQNIDLIHAENWKLFNSQVIVERYALEEICEMDHFELGFTQKLEMIILKQSSEMG